MIRVLILSPFRYTYGNKNSYLTTGESLYLDPKQEADREELKYLLSPASEVRRFVYVEESELNSNFLLELLPELSGGTPVPDYVGNTTPEIPETPVQDLAAPPQEPEENIFLNPEINSTLESDVEEVAPEQEEVSPTAEELSLEQQIEARREALDALHWKKLESIAKTYGIDYSDKDQAIQDILTKEFE